MQPMSFKFDPEAAKKAGTMGISENGAYEGVIASAIYTFGKDGSQSQALEISLDSNGAKANYLRINYLGKDGEPTFGMGLISALMWAAGIKEAAPVQIQGPEGVEWHNQALVGKSVGLVLQKTLYPKADGKDGYRMEIRQAFKCGTRKTSAEHAENAPAEAVDKMVAALTGIPVVIFFCAGDPRRSRHVQFDALFAISAHDYAGMSFCFRHGDCLG